MNRSENFTVIAVTATSVPKRILGSALAESEWARNMRNEAEKQTKLLEDQAKHVARSANAQQQQTQFAAQSVYAQQEAARQAESAAASAARSEQIAHEQLLEQIRMARQNHGHNFAMWRQTTNNGQSYDQWLFQAQPLVDEFKSRWNQWRAAQESDIATVAAARREQSVGKFNVNVRAVKNIQECGGTLSAAFMNPALKFMVIAVIACVCWLVVTIGKIFSQDVADFARTISLGTSVLYVLVLAYLVGEFVVRIPRGMRIMKVSAVADAWCQAEVDAFTSSLPVDWNEEEDALAWNQLVDAEETIDSMPEKYVEFTPLMLVDMDRGLPAARSSATIAPEAESTRALLDLWTAKHESALHSR